VSACSPDRFVVFNDDGGIVPTAAYDALRDVWDAGHQVYLDPADNNVVVERGRGLPPIPADQITALRRWRYHVRMLVAFYTQAAASAKTSDAKPPSNLPVAINRDDEAHQ